MDRLPAHSNEGFPNDNLFGNSHNYNSYDNLNLFANGTDPTFNDASWGVNANQSRGQPVSNWQQNANHLAATSSHAGFNGQSSPYGRNLNQSPVPFSQNQFGNYGAQQNYQYQQPRYDPSLVTQSGNGQNFNLGSHGYNSPGPNGATITPQALQREGQPSNLQYAIPQNYAQAMQNRAIPNPLQYRAVDQNSLLASIPKGADNGMFSIINFDNLARATNSERMNNFVNVGKEAIEWDCTRSAIPSYVQRHSRHDLRMLVGNNTSALAKIGKKSSKHRDYATLSSDIKPVSRVGGPSNVKQEPESSSSEESSSDDGDDDSEYSESEDEDTPLPAKRPDSPRAGVEYDTIKALWYSKRRPLTTDIIKKRLIEFWELMKMIRDHWKGDQEAVTNAEEKKETTRLPLLQSRVKDHRDKVEAAFKAALRHGHRGIIEVLAENTALVFLCYQFLLDRWKADDVNGTLSRAILDLMSNFTTLTTSTAERVHLHKVFPRYQKKGDARTKHWVGKILANIEAADKDAAARAERKASEQPGSKADQVKSSSPPTKKATPQPVAGVKRAAITSEDSTAQKKVATGAVKPGTTAAATTKTNGVVKKPAVTAQSLRGDATKAAANNTAVRKTVVAKPSGFFSSLQSAQKKPGTSNADKASASAGKPAAAKPAEPVKPGFSFAETMARISKPKEEEKPAPKKETKVVPNETPEERAKRIRKEQRRKLRVEFKKGEDLVQIKYFTHDPEEEINHGEGQMRDISDAGGEGRALKQSQLMDIDDEDDVEETQDIRAHEPITLVDFSGIKMDERERNYAPYGGGLLEPKSAERAVREHYEDNNLIVFYSSRDDIPPNPREPADPYNGDQGGPIKQFGRGQDKYYDRVQARQARRQGQHNYGQPMAPQYGWPQQAQQPQAPPPPAGGVPDIASILAQLVPQGQQPQTSYAPPQPTVPATSQGWGMPGTAPPPPPPGLDLNAILASLNAANAHAGQNGAAAAPMMNYGGQGQQQQNTKGHPKYKTQVCKYWQDGKCHKGDSCSYRHD